MKHTDHMEIADLLLGRKVVRVEDHNMYLDNGTLVVVDPNEGCGGCASGWYELKSLNDMDNIITKVELVIEELSTSDDNCYSNPYSYKLFVYADNTKVNLFTVDGDDGNEYYETGFSLRVYPDGVIPATGPTDRWGGVY